MRCYIGITANIRRRLEWHNAGRCPHTSKHKPWELVVAIEFAEERRAVAFENYLKSGSGRAFAKRHFEQ
jgi:predicted GIY-YIG superfamily endonuclease